MARFTSVLREILVRYDRTPHVTQSDIAHELGRNRSTVNAACKRLVVLGYLSKNAQGDYRMTEAGRSALKPPATALRYIRCPDCGKRFSA
jgi:Mn-dependent DtxR family transcriptional regulator